MKYPQDNTRFKSLALLFTFIWCAVDSVEGSPHASLEVRQTPLPAGWSSLGCYTDSALSRTLRTASFTSVASMTISSCIDFCSSRGFNYAGLEFGRECYCDNSIRYPAFVTNAGDCNMACTGDSSSKCGAGERLSVYMTPPTPTTTIVAPHPTATGYSLTFDWNLIGCFGDPVHPTRALQHQVTIPGGTTPERCVSACTAGGWTVAGVEFGSECWCDDYMPYDFFTYPPEQYCNMPCSGDQTLACGGANHIQLYLNYKNTGPGPGCLSDGRDPKSYPPFQFRAIYEEGPVYLSTALIDTDDSGRQTFIVIAGPGFNDTTFTYSNGILKPYGFLGNPVALPPVIGETPVFVTNTDAAPFTGYCASPFQTDGLPWYGFPRLLAAGPWAICHNESADRRLELIYAPVPDHPNYDIIYGDCLSPVDLQLFIPTFNF